VDLAKMGPHQSLQKQAKGNDSQSIKPMAPIACIDQGLIFSFPMNPEPDEVRIHA
jgi:hypothetical protein